MCRLPVSLGSSVVQCQDLLLEGGLYCSLEHQWFANRYCHFRDLIIFTNRTLSSLDHYKVLIDSHTVNKILYLKTSLVFIPPSSEGTYYGMVISVRVSIRSSVSFPHFSPTCFDILSWNFVCHFFLWNIRSSSSVVNFRHFCWSYSPFGT